MSQTTTAKYFAYAHLPVHLQIISKPIGQLAELLEALLPAGPEKSAGMRKLLEAKDCMVRAALDVPAADLLASAPITDSDRIEVLYGMMFGTLGIDEATVEKLLAPLDVKGFEDLNPEVMRQALDNVVVHLRQPKQHTEDPDHA